jgi:hypothetical protein
MMNLPNCPALAIVWCGLFDLGLAADPWRLDSQEAWAASAAEMKGMAVERGLVVMTADRAVYRSKVVSLPRPRTLRSLRVEQSAAWNDWQAVAKVGPKNLRDAPVFLVRGEGDYWLFGLHGGGGGKGEAFQAEPAELEGFEVPLMTTPFPNQYDAPGGLKPSLGGYHAWQSRDMVHWVHHGPVTEKFSRWVTTAEQVGDTTYIYYDYPNDQDPHLYMDDDLTDGRPGKNVGMAFRDPSHGSDCTVIRDLDGRFHVIYEDWSPINARQHSWDSPLAGHAAGRKGFGDFEILAPAVDERTEPTGETATYLHPHWKKEHPDWDSNVAEYEVHRPTQDAFGDWAAIGIGGRYYLFGDYHPAGKGIRIARFTSESLGVPFEFCGELGSGHPDPDIGFAAGRFYLINQTRHDYVSTGPWVEGVEARLGVDRSGDGKVDQWTPWQAIAERYERIEGFAKQVARVPASLDVGSLPPARGFAFELRVDREGEKVWPEFKEVQVEFAD